MAAAFHGLLESAKIAGLDPVEYLREAVRRGDGDTDTPSAPRRSGRYTFAPEQSRDGRQIYLGGDGGAVAGFTRARR